MPKASLFPINSPGSRPAGIRSQTEARGRMSFFLKMTAVEERSKWNRSLLCLSAACPGQTWEGN
jgi:hypothetical protein